MTIPTSICVLGVIFASFSIVVSMSFANVAMALGRIADALEKIGAPK